MEINKLENKKYGKSIKVLFLEDINKIDKLLVRQIRK